MKNRIVKKILRIIFLVLVGAAVIGTFYFLWKKAQPVITVYEVVTPSRDTIETKTVATGKVEPRDEVLIKPQMSYHFRIAERSRTDGERRRNHRTYQGDSRNGPVEQCRIARTGCQDQPRPDQRHFQA